MYDVHLTACNMHSATGMVQPAQCNMHTALTYSIGQSKLLSIERSIWRTQLWSTCGFAARWGREVREGSPALAGMFRPHRLKLYKQYQSEIAVMPSFVVASYDPWYDFGYPCPYSFLH